MKLLGGILRGSKKIWFFMSQHRNNSVRGEMIDKKWFTSTGCEGCTQACQREWPQELTGIQFYNQRKSGEGEKVTFFLILE